jgi:hypothetical protein
MFKGQNSYVNFMVFSLGTVEWQLNFSLEKEIAILRLITAELSNRDNTEFAKGVQNHPHTNLHPNNNRHPQLKPAVCIPTKLQ